MNIIIKYNNIEHYYKHQAGSVIYNFLSVIYTTSAPECNRQWRYQVPTIVVYKYMDVLSVRGIFNMVFRYSGLLNLSLRFCNMTMLQMRRFRILVLLLTLAFAKRFSFIFSIH